MVGACAATASAQLPATSGDPRIGLAPGLTDAGVASKGLQHLANRPKPESVSGTNSDIAFQGTTAFVGNYNGINIYDIADPANPVLKTAMFCPGSQNDVSIWGNLLFVSVESTAAKKDCTANTTENPTTAENRFRGIRIFDVSNLEAPQQVAQVQTCRGSHTHTLVRPKNDAANVYIYVSGTAGVRPDTELAGCQGPTTGDPNPAEFPNPSRWRIDVIKVPVANPAAAAVVNNPRLFANEAGAVNGLQNGPQTPQHPCASATPACTVTGPTGGANWSPVPNTDACHDITVYEELDLAAGACEGNGLLIDISDPANPKRIDAVADPQFAYWHGATFSNDGKVVVFTDEWGGGSAARCRATDQLSWGANAIYEIVDRKFVFKSYYKLPVAQTVNENCVSHVGNLIPIPGRNILAQAWYQGGISIMDFTDPANPKEIGYFDRGPVAANGTSVSNGGFWSAYWYNGRIYGSEIARGFDTFKLSETEHLTAGEIASAERISFPRLNAQSQDRVTTWTSAPVEGGVGGNVPATLSVSLGAPASFGAFTPGVARDYTAATTATVTSSAGNAALIVQDTSPFHTNHLVNGSYALSQPLQVKNDTGAFQTMPAGLKFWGAPTASESVPIELRQSITANEPLRTGSYSKTLTFTLSTTQP